MRIKLFVGLWLVLIVFVMVSICKAETETQLLNRAKIDLNADYQGERNNDGKDGEVTLKSTNFYVKQSLPNSNNKRLVPNKFYYAVCADGKAFRRSK